MSLHNASFSIVIALLLGACQSNGQASDVSTDSPDQSSTQDATSWGTGPTVRASASPTAERDANLIVDVTLSFRYSGLIIVDYATSDREAKEGEDYQRTKGQLRFNPGQTQQTIQIPLIDDDLAEGDESFVLQLHVANRGKLEQPEILLSIIDDD
jgi:hypothetical protein